MKKKSKLTIKTIGEHVRDWKSDFEILRIKAELIGAIKMHCERNKTSQRKLASMVPGLTQDRISKIFSGKHDHMTLDKLVKIASALQFTVSLTWRYSSAARL